MIPSIHRTAFASEMREVSVMLTNRIFISLVVFILVGLLYVAVPAQPPSETMDAGLGGTNVIIGTVLVTTGGRLERRVSVRLRTMMAGDRVTSTDENGTFSFRGLVSGDYTIIIDKEKDFEPYTQSVNIIQVRGFPPTSINLSIRLTPKASTQPKPGVLDVQLANLPEAGQTLYKKAKDLEAAGDNVSATEQLLQLTSQYPNFMLGFNELGLVYMRTGQLEKADAALQTAIKLAPDVYQPKMNRGMVLVTMKRYADAEPVLRAAQTLNDQSGPIKYFLGTALANLGKFDEAEKDLSLAVLMGGNEMVEAHRILAIIYSSKGDKKRAAAELEIYLKINPTAADAAQLQKVVQQLRGTQEQPPVAKP
jgi:Flp pilus assembly protein TadD